MTFKLKAAAMAAFTAAVLAPVVVSAAPKTTLYGGGATLPANVYIGYSWIKCPASGFDSAGNACTPNTVVSPNPERLSIGGEVGSLFGSYTASTASTPIAFPVGTTTRPAISYCQTGSGTGRNALIGDGGKTADGSCPDYAGTPTGFGAPSGQINPDFSASDAPLGATEYADFMTHYGSTRGEPVQVPEIAGAIALVYQNPDTGSAFGAKPINLTESQICRIFSGAITNWSQLGFASRPIKVVYRSDGSGTSFSFSNHISAVCPTAQPTGVTGFSTQSTFSAAFVGGTPPAGSIAASGNGGVVTAINNPANVGAIGYAEISDASVRAALAGNVLQYATVSLRSDTLNPVTGKPWRAKSPLKIAKAFKLASGAVHFDEVIGSNDANGRPQLVAISPAPVRAGCVLIADPSTYATSVARADDGDYQYYPIMAVSYLLANGAGNGEDTLNIQALLASGFGKPDTTTDATPSITNAKGLTTDVGTNKGFAYLAGFPNPTKTVIKSCILP